MSTNRAKPGLLIAAAFVGPGTVTICTLAGATHQYELLWVLLISTIVTIFLQEMVSRLGIVTGKDLPLLIKQEIKYPWIKYGSIGLIMAAIIVGNASYEAGNISGAALGLNVLGGLKNYAPLIIGSVAFILLAIGSFDLIQKFLTGLVLLMSASFAITAVMTMPSLSLLLSGLLLPSFPEDGLLLILGLVGTTIVPYNLFLHASLVTQGWNVSELKTLRKDTIISIGIGGIISMCIVICAAAIPANTEISGIEGLAKGLTTLYGSYANVLISMGLFAAGITSAITAPLAAAYVAAGCFGWSSDLRSIRMKIVWGSILIIGIAFSSLGYKPIDVIRFAQVANGLLLPTVSIFILWLAMNKKLLGGYVNKAWQSGFGLIIILLMIILGAKSILSVL
ncbi:MAG: Nramp family divalent metal transporter [Cyclobacteriaceae bacterium]